MKYKVAYVDDDPDLAWIIERVLSPHYELVIYQDPQVALKELSQFSPDFLILDMMMPDMSGPELLKELHQASTFPRIPVVFMTAHKYVDENPEFKELGVVEIWQKPLKANALPGMIREVLETHLSSTSHEPN